MTKESEHLRGEKAAVMLYWVSFRLDATDAQEKEVSHRLSRAGGEGLGDDLRPCSGAVAEGTRGYRRLEQTGLLASTNNG